MTSLKPYLFLASFGVIWFLSIIVMTASSEMDVVALPFLTASLSSSMVDVFTVLAISVISFSTSSDMFMSPM